MSTVSPTSGPVYIIVSGITYANTCARIAWEDVARIIRKAVGNRSTEGLHIILNKDADQMDDYELYDCGKWKYKPTPFVDLLFHMQANPQLFTGGRCI